MLATIVCGVGPNGMAQRQRRGRGDTFAIIAHFWQIAPARERQEAAVRWNLPGWQAILQSTRISEKKLFLSSRC